VGFIDSLKKLFKSKPKSDLPIVEVAKRFDLLGRTGQGSMSKVWRARDRMTARTVCLKILDKVKTARFEARFPGLDKPSEGVICMALKHKNVVQTFEHGLTTEGEQFIVMELIEGVGLNFMIETRSPHLEGKRIHLLSQFAEGLEHIHKQGFIHRDVCPRNIMVTTDGTVKIIDMGLTLPNKKEFCRPGNRTGTTDFLAPEIIKRQSTDARVDMFALGVTAYEVFTCTHPWEKATSQEVLASHINSPGRDPLDSRADLDPKTVAFLKKAIERNPDNRFQTAAEFREALKDLPRKW